MARPPRSLGPLQAAVLSWPLGLVLASAPVRVTGPRRALELLSCLRGLQEGSREDLGCGITSIRALPQVPTPPSCLQHLQLPQPWEHSGIAFATSWHWLPCYKSPSGLGGETFLCLHQELTGTANCARFSAEHSNLQSLS